MTTIAAKDGILACDSRATESDYSAKTDLFTKLYAVNCKVKPLHGRVLMAAAGDEFAGELFRQWLIKGGRCDLVEKGVQEDEEGGGTIDVLLLHKSGMYLSNHLGAFIKVRDTCWAIGTGRAPALAVMYRGGSAIEAINMAKRIDVHSGGRTCWMKL